MAGSDLEARLLAFLRSLGLPQLRDAKPDTPLIQSGYLDSMGLVHLAVWIEAEVGRPLTPGTFDMAAEWNTVSDIVAFIDRES